MPPAPRWTADPNRRRRNAIGPNPASGSPRRIRVTQRPGAGDAGSTPRTSASESPYHGSPGGTGPVSALASGNGWDREWEVFPDFDLPPYVGPSTFSKLPWVTEPAELRARGVDVAIVGAPFDDMVTHRSGARFGPRAIREAQYSVGSLNSLQLGVEPFSILTVVDAGDANIVPTL